MDVGFTQAVVARARAHRRPRRHLRIHTAGFDLDAAVFPIFDVSEIREHGERFLNDQLNSILKSTLAAATSEDMAPPTRATCYELHDSMTG